MALATVCLTKEKVLRFMNKFGEASILARVSCSDSGIRKELIDRCTLGFQTRKFEGIAKDPLHSYWL